MPPIHVVWDLEDDPDGNIQHIAEHDVEPAEVETVINDPASQTTTSRSSGADYVWIYERWPVSRSRLGTRRR